MNTGGREANTMQRSQKSRQRAEGQREKGNKGDREASTYRGQGVKHRRQKVIGDREANTDRGVNAGGRESKEHE